MTDHNGPQTAGSTGFFPQMMQVRGFITQFTYTVSNFTKLPNQRPDGLAFVIQASAAGTQATGAPASGLGYGSTNVNPGGIMSSIAVEFDSWYNAELHDPPVFHISVHSNGPLANGADEQYRIGDMFENAAYDLDEQRVTITYDPVENGGTMRIQFNDQPVLPVRNISLQALASLDPASGNAWVGFTAGTHTAGNATKETIAITDWRFQFLGQISSANTMVSLPANTTAGDLLPLSVAAVDQYNNPMIVDGVSRGNYVLTATLTEANGNLLNTSASYSGEGKYVLSFNATASGPATVRVYLNSTLVGSGEYPLPVLPAAPFAPLSYPYGFTEGVSTPAVAGVTGSFFVQLCDGFGNNITTDVGPVVLATITPSFDSTYSLQVEGVYEPVSQRYLVNYNVTLSGNFTLQVTVNNEPTSSGTHALEVLPNEVDPETSVLYGVASTATAGELQTAYLQLKDVFGNNASTSDVDILIQAKQVATVVNGSLATCDQGLCPITYNLTVASYGSDEYSIFVLVEGQGVVGSAQTYVKVSPAALSPSVSYAYGQGLASGVAGEIAYFYVQLTDVFGNNNSYPAAGITAKLTAGTFETAPKGTPLANGLYEFQYNVTWATSYSLSIFVEAQEIANSQNTVAIAPNAVFPPNCVAFGTGLGDQLVVGDNNTFYVQLRDEFHNNITTSGSETLLVVISSDSLQVNASTSFVDGLYEVSYNITAASDYNVTMTVNDIPIFNAAENITLLPAPIYPPECVATSVETGVTAGALSQFRVQLRDVYANDIRDVPEPSGIVTATLTPQDFTINIAYEGAGSYLLSYNVTLAGAYSLTISVNSTAISGGGQYEVQVVPAAAYPPLSFSVGPALAGSVAGQNSSFLIYLFDAFNNSITQPSQDDTPVVSIAAQPFELVFDTSVAAFAVFYNITTSDSYVVTVVVAGIQITQSTLTVVPAPLFAPNSLASGPSLSGAVAGEAGTFNVYQRDIFGNLIKDYSQVTTLNCTLTLDTLEVVLPPTQNGDGSWAFNYNLTVAGFYTTRITINGVDILGSPLNFTEILAAPFNPHGTITKGLLNSVTAGALNGFTIQLRDIWGNDVSDANLPNPVAPGDIDVQFNATSIDINVTAQATGVFLVQYNYTKAGVYWMSVTINSTEVGPNAPGYVTVSPNDVFPPNCVADGDATSEAIVKQTSTFTLIVRDRFNNSRMWSPTPPTITLVANGLGERYGSAQEQSDGSYLVSYYIPERTTYTMSVMFGSAHIHGSPFTLNTNYGNNSPPTVVIVCAVIGSVVVVGAIIGGFVWYRRRRQPYIALLE